MSFGGSSRLKFYKRLNIYKNSTNSCSFNPETFEAYSYNWTFVKKFSGIVIFNSYSYSPTTNQHQWAVRHILDEKKIKYIEINLGRDSLGYGIESKIKDVYQRVIDKMIQDEIRSINPRVKYTNKYSINNTLKSLDKLFQVIPKLKLNQKIIKELEKERVLKYFTDLNEKEMDKCYKYLCIQDAQTNFNSITI